MITGRLGDFPHGDWIGIASVCPSRNEQHATCGATSTIWLHCQLTPVGSGAIPSSFPEILNFEKVKKGDVFYLPPGRIHAIGAGILLTEIQQSSDITYRIFDWNRTDDKGNPRELHTDMALKAMDFNFYNTYKSKYETRLNHTTNMVDCPYFFTNVLYFDKPVEKDYNLIDSFVIYIAVDGNFIIKPEGGENVEVVKGESILLPAIIKNLVLEPKGLAQILEVYIK